MSQKGVQGPDLPFRPGHVWYFRLGCLKPVVCLKDMGHGCVCQG